jgi:hypothetical protein
MPASSPCIDPTVDSCLGSGDHRVMACPQTRHQRTYDHRLRDLVRAVGDPEIVSEFGVPRSTALGWLRGDYAPVVTAQILDMDDMQLRAEILKLRRRIRMLAAIVRLLAALLRAFDVRLDRTRLPGGEQKTELLRVIERAQDALSLRGALRVLRMSPSRYHEWRRAERGCELDDQSSCPRSTPTRLTAAEILTIKEMVESPEYRHVPTGRLAILAQRLGRVFAAPGTWYRLVRERAWRRPELGSIPRSRRTECGPARPMSYGTST